MSAAVERWLPVALLALAVGGLLFVGPAASGGDPVDPGTDLPREAITAQDRPVPVDGNVDALHERGITGHGTTVAVVGAAFTPDVPAVADGVVGHRSFADERSHVPDADPDHDTAVAEVVGQVAPEADLVLAEVGPNPTVWQYRAAMQWLVAEDVDVVVDAASYFPRDGATTDGFAAVDEEVSDAGVVVVTSAGNLGQRHWEGTADGEGWVTFADGVEGNRLGDGPIAGDVSVRLHAADPSLDLYLYREQPGDDAVVAKDTRDDEVAAIDARVPRGEYYVAVHASEPVEDASLNLYVPTHDLATANGDGVPRTVGDGAVAVSAEQDGDLHPRSSRGTIAGSDVPLAAPANARTSHGELTGTSAAAPYVAGTLALVDDDLSAEQKRAVLFETAERRDEVARVDPHSAVHAAEGKRDDAAGEPPRRHGRVPVADPR